MEPQSTKATHECSLALRRRKNGPPKRPEEFSVWLIAAELSLETNRVRELETAAEIELIYEQQL